jgi:hypothetical protein
MDKGEHKGPSGRGLSNILMLFLKVNIPPSPSLEKEVLFSCHGNENPLSETTPAIFFCFGRKGTVSMVRPTVTKDVPACNNRFAVLDETYAAYQIRRALQDTSGKDPPPPPQCRAPPLSWLNQLTLEKQLILAARATSHALPTRRFSKVESNTFVNEVALLKGRAVIIIVCRRKPQESKPRSAPISR